MKFSLYIIISIFLFSVYLFAEGQPRADLEKKRKEKLKEMEKIEALISKAKENKDLSLNQINLINRKITVRNEIIEDLSNELNQLDVKLDIVSNSIYQKNLEIQKLKEEYAKIVYNSYYRIKNYNQLLFIFSSENFNQAYRRFYFLKEYTTHRKNILLSINREIGLCQVSIINIKIDRDRKVLLLSQRESETKSLEKDKEQQKNLIESYNKKEKELRNDLKEIQLATRKIEIEIEKVIQEEAALKKKKTKKAVSDDLVLTKKFSENKGKIPWPVDNATVISYFGEHPHPVFKGIMVKNNGIDISTNCKAPVYSIFGGVVSKIFAIKGANFVVILRHGDFLSVYKNLQEVNIKVGESVTLKQKIGFSYCNTDNNVSTIHLEIWQELSKMNPLDWLANNN